MLRAADGRTVAGVLVAGAAIAALLWRRRNNAVSSPQITTSLLVCSMCKTMQDKSATPHAVRARSPAQVPALRRKLRGPAVDGSQTSSNTSGKKTRAEEEERAQREQPPMLPPVQ